MTAFLPVELLARLHGGNGHRPAAVEFPAAVLYVDVSRYTSLVERLTRRGQEGLERIPHLLGLAHTRCIEKVYELDGEVLTLAGDALVAYWPGDIDGLERALRSATRCAELLCGGGTSDAGLTGTEDAPMLHAGVGAGLLWAAALGGHPNWCVFVGGEAAKQSARALANARPGHYLVSDDAALALELFDQHSFPPPPRDSTTLPADWLSGFLPVELGEVLGRDTSSGEHAGSSLDGARSKPVDVVNGFDGLAEVRPITALFARIAGLEYGPDALARHQTLCAALQEDLRRCDGPIGELLFDDKGLVFRGVFGGFGRFHRDDAPRALEAAGAMIQTTRRLGLTASIGVATGDALFRVVGGTKRRQLTALGAPMNRAARLMTAIADGVLCDAPTERASRRRFRFAEHGILELEGLGDAAAVFRPMEPQAVGFARAPLIGRERELELLHRAFLEASGGVQRLVIVSGEPGLGKSHLVEAFSESLDAAVTMLRVERNDRQTWLRPWRRVIASLLRLPAETDGATIVAELTCRFANDPSVLGRLPLLEAMLAVPVPQTDSTRHLDGPHRADAIMRLLGDVLGALAPRPLTLIVEDSQWLDSASWRLLEWVLTSRSSLLVVVCVRTGEAPEMLTAFRRRVTAVPANEADGSHFCRTLDLEDLSDSALRQIVARTLASAPAHEELVRRIVELADGNPFFAEEITLTLKSEGLIAMRGGCWRALRPLDGLRYFEGVERVIRERIDTLDANSQAVLKAAAIIGRAFTRSALTPMLPEMGQDRVDESLRALSGAHLVRETGEDGQYAFRHDQTRDVVYGSIPRDVRQRLHTAVAGWIEASRTASNGADTAVLVHHFHAGGSRDKAIEYAELAAARALQTGAFREAEAFLGICLSYETRAAREPERQLNAIRWRRQLGEAYYGVGDIKAQGSSIRRALALAGYPLPESAPALLLRLIRSSLHLAVQQLLPPAFIAAPAANADSHREIACCLSQAAVVDFFELRLLRAFCHAIAAVNHAERSGPSKEAILASAQLACAFGILGRRRASNHFITRAERAAIALDDSSARAQVYYLDALWRIGYCEWDMVDGRLDQSQALCLAAGDQLTWCNAQAIRFWSLYYRADQGALERTAQALLSRAQNSGNVQQEIWALRCKSLCLLHADSPREAVDILRLTASALPGSADLAERVSSTGVLALALARVGLNGESIDAAVETLALLQQMRRPTVHSTLPGISGVAEVLLRGREAGLSNAYDQWSLWERQALRHLDRYRRAFPVGRAQYGLWAGVAAWLDGRHDGALRTWNDARAFARRFSLKRDESLIAAEIRRAEVQR